MDRRAFLKTAGVVSVATAIRKRLWGRGKNTEKRHINVLFIMTDQHRWDALSCAGNSALHTPNIDRLAKEGVYFENAYASCPACVPARTVILTGQSPFTVNVLGNKNLRSNKEADVPTFDSLLSEQGYRTEYYGKWHAPDRFSKSYDNPVWLKKKNPGSISPFRAYLDKRVPRRPPMAGELIDKMSQRPYRPLPIDIRYEMSQGRIEEYEKKEYKIKHDSKKKDKKQNARSLHSYGRLEVPQDCSLAAFQGQGALEALDRMDPEKPFSLTCSFTPPHSPMVVPEPYFSRYKPENMLVPKSISDDLKNSPYRPQFLRGRYSNPDRIREMKAVYYALVSQIDDWVGRLLAKLREKGLEDNTLVVFTSDHGEMLGDHGLYSKFMMYEGSSHIPLIMRLPGVIPAGARVTVPVSQVDLFATILDYTGLNIPRTDGRSLRRLIEGRNDDLDYTVSSFRTTFMVRTKEWKLILRVRTNLKKKKRRKKRERFNALYNLKTDPLEMNNLIGNNPEKDKHMKVATDMKQKLTEWMIRTKNPLLANLKETEI